MENKKITIHTSKFDYACNKLLSAHNIDDSMLSSILSQAMSRGDDFADIYLQDNRNESWSMQDGIITHCSCFSDQGFGLRTIAGDKTSFIYSQHLEPETLIQSARTLRSSSGCMRQILPVNPGTFPYLYDHEDTLEHRSAYEIVALLKKIHTRAYEYAPQLRSISATLTLAYSVVIVKRHDGYLAADCRPMATLQLNMILEYPGQHETVSGGFGGRGGMSLFTFDKIESEIQRMASIAAINAVAVPFAGGQMPVVIAPGWPGMLLHEAMGHGFEADFNRSGASVYSGMLKQRVANPNVTIVDDATIPGQRGSLQMDDEGEPGQRTTLVEKGILRSYMQDNLNSRMMKQPRTGNGRRQSYAHLPMPRMTNTFMVNGQYFPEEIIASVRKGIFLADLGSGQVDIVSGQFNFESALAYTIENGQLGHPVKTVTLIGDGPDTLKKISMVGNDLALDRGNAVCGKSGQNVAVSVGQPTLKIDELTVSSSV